MVNSPASYLEIAAKIKLPLHVDENNHVVKVGDRVAVTYGGQPATGTIGVRVVPIITFDSAVEGGIASAQLQDDMRMVRLDQPTEPLLIEARS